MYLACCAHCILSWIEGLVQYFNHYAFTQVAIYGKDYCSAAKATWALIQTKGVDAIVNDNLIGAVLTMGGLFIGLLCGGLSYVFYIFSEMPKDHFAYPLTMFLFCFIIAFTEFLILSEVINSGVSATFVCLSEDANIEWNGIILALIASIGYAVSNVVQELVIKFEDNIYPAAALFAMGATGSFVSAFVANFTNFGIEDRNSLLNSTSNNKYFIVGYIISVALFYILAPKYIQAFSAVTFSFNLLTSDIFIFLFNKFYMQRSLNNLYLAGFFTVLFGLVIFNFGKVSEVYIDEPSVEYLALEEFDDSIES
ncbi:putative choline transporter, neither null mutation nor overexpression affects choline transport [Lobulomyces angularis]|nr:putative choline transporter, neither null mutation nor overexpression affects choline transport [Lobulomyces angularis]